MWIWYYLGCEWCGFTRVSVHCATTIFMYVTSLCYNIHVFTWLTPQPHIHAHTQPPSHTRPRSLNIHHTMLSMFNDCGSQHYPRSCCVLGQQTSMDINLSTKPVMLYSWRLSDGNVWEEVIQATSYLGQCLPTTMMWCLKYVAQSIRVVNRMTFLGLLF